MGCIETGAGLQTQQGGQPVKGKDSPTRPSASRGLIHFYPHFIPKQRLLLAVVLGPGYSPSHRGDFPPLPFSGSH